MNDNLTEKDIINSNLFLHKLESNYYDIIHPEIFNEKEQKRLRSDLKKATKLIRSGNKKALEIGCGTGNLTGKLLEMGFEVTALDISKEMIDILKKKYYRYYKSNKLKLAISNAEKLNFKSNTFDFIAAYSVLHHLPDYIKSIKEMIRVLKVGGVIYLDHERTDRYWQRRFRIIRYLDLFSNSIFNFIYIKNRGIKIRSLIPIYMSYGKADYHISEKYYVNHNNIKRTLRRGNVEKIYLKNYYLFPTHYFNPFSIFYRIFLSKDMCLLIARK